MRVSIHDTSGWLASSGFQDGDLIIAVNGTEFSDEAQMQMAFAAAMANEEVVFTVQRGSSTVKVTTDAKGTMDRGSFGGGMSPAAR